jgi:uncharacterized phage protein (TIGR02218 family)
MSRVFFGSELEGVAVYWRVERPDGVTLGFTSHDRDLEFDGVRFRSAPGMVPSAIRRTASLEPDSAEVQGAISHSAISPADLSAGRFDFSKVEVGLVDWETLERSSLYRGEIGTISSDGTSFESELRSLKSNLEQDTVPRTSPTCRARFCGPGCNLSGHRFTHEAAVSEFDAGSGKLAFNSAVPAAALNSGFVRWIDGPHAGIRMRVLEAADDGLLLDGDLASTIAAGDRALLREGCDHTFATCAGRFANGVNFQGEPFLPGNDALVRYPTSSS